MSDRGGPPVDRRVLFFGDSYVAGVGDPNGLGWVGRVTATSFAAGLPLTAYNLGIRRETSRDVAARFEREALPRLTPDADCRAVICVGANDTTVDAGERRVPLAESLETLDALLDRLGLATFVVGPPPLGDDSQQSRVLELSGAFATVCRGRGVPFVEVAEPLGADGAWLVEARAADGYHPAAGGYEALAGLVLAGGWLRWLRAPCR